jgi:hypothetical protein
MPWLKGFDTFALPINLLLQACLIQPLIGHIALVGSDLDALKKAVGKAQRD